MKLPFINQRTTILVLMLSIIVACWIGARPVVHGQEKLPAASGHINDFAAVLDTASKDRLEQILINLKERTGIDFVIATVKSTGSEKIYDYSLRIANDWNIGVSTSATKSLLLTISTDNGEFLAQISRGARAQLPDGLVGEMRQRMQEKIKSAGYNEGVLTGVKTFANGLGARNNFTFADLDTHPAETRIAEQQRPRTVKTPTPEATETPAPSPTETPKPEATATIAPPAESSQPSATPEASVTPPIQPTETAAAPTPSASLAATPSPQTTESPAAAIDKTPTPSDSPTAKAPPAGSPKEESAANSTTPNGPSTDRKTATNIPANPDDEKEAVEVTLTLPPDKRIDALTAFIAAHPQSVAVL